MKKLLLMLVVLAATTLFTACTKKAETPSEKAIEMIGYIQDGKYEAYVDNIDAGKEGEMSAEDKAELTSMLETKGSQLQSQKKGITSCEALEETISEDGNSATVKVKIVYGDGTDDTDKIKLVKNAEGKWLGKLK